ncbi:hypothetical protein [Acetobacter cerevisiae]|uniref:Uncharacterized protein n=1 Tax=Acetobacter cerevisiae TaxID=178900 RepID=A0A149QKZ1_9PROT|nr:hypothetical protein [Acetobacter cerevisiae]KXU97806.1 hypothetical protein AD928_03395 [Acetobacter cerevisiae]GBQ06951.1 hypothetical protein AA14362_1102 [Acetobacter cerevisiae DSM 14362]
MPKLNADFVADWVAMLRSYLIGEQKWSAVQVAALPDWDLPSHYFDAQRRRIASIPRTIEIGDSFVCPPCHEAGWIMLQEKVRKGEDINSHLSTRHISLFNPDGLLAEWGVHHFHLGTTLYPKNPAFADRTGPLLYAIVGDEAFYAINVYDHHSFENIDVLESIHRNWPEMISRYRVKGVTGGAWDKEQRQALRRKNANVAVTTSDGTVYMPISGGVVASGINLEAIRLADYWSLKIRGFQSDFEKQLTSLLPTLTQNRYAGEDTIEAELKSFSGENAQVFLPKYDVLATVALVQSALSP